MSTKEPIPRSWVSENLIPLGTPLFAALTLLAQYVLPTTWISLITVSCPLILTVVSLYAPVVRWLSSLANKWRLQHLAKIYFPQLLESARRFRQFISRQNINTLLYVLQQVAQWGEQKGKSLLPDPEYRETVENWLFSIEKRIALYKPDDFPGLCKEMSDLILSYNRFCSQRLRKLEELIRSGDLPEQRLRQIKQQWNVQRGDHTAFVREWGIFAKRINEKTGSKICFDYYEPVGTLE